MKKILLIIMVLSSLIWGDRFTRDSNGIVTDNSTHLQWQDDYSDNSDVIKVTTWEPAIDYCEALDLNGTGWRLPNMNELLTIVDYTQYDPAIDPIFQYTHGLYWSSTSSYTDLNYDQSYAKVVIFTSGYVLSPALKYRDSYSTRCVRGGD